MVVPNYKKSTLALIL
jgi:transposase-like protein